MPSPLKVWGTQLESGVRARHLFCFYAAAFATILFAVLINALQPFLLTSVLDIPLREQGRVSGHAAFVGEVILVFSISAFGVLSDRIGRRLVYSLGFACVALGFLLSPWGHSNSWLFLSRGVFAIGIAAATAMLSVIAADYVIDRDRGKANAIMGIMNGLGAVAAALGLAKLPQFLQSTGQSGEVAARSSYGLFCGLALLAAVLLLWGLKREHSKQQNDEHRLNFLRMAKEGLRAAQKNRSIALCYAAAFVARADLAVAGVFFPLWLSKHFSGRLDPSLSEVDRLQALDLATASGVAAGGQLIGVIGGAALLFAPIAGLLCDRWNRFTVLIIALLINTVGYGLTYFVLDPTQSSLYGMCLVIGCGQVGAVIASQVLIQQFAPEENRGAIVGTFGSFGALGIMVTLLLGGWLFDHWMEAGPFVLLAFLNALLGLVVLAFRLLQRPEPSFKIFNAVES